MTGAPSNENEVVEAAARVFESVEQKIEKLTEIVPKLKPPIEAGVGFFMTGRLNAERMKAEVDAINGLLAEARMRVYRLHQECTKIAQDRNVDLPTVFGGGDR